MYAHLFTTALAAPGLTRILAGHHRVPAAWADEGVALAAQVCGVPAARAAAVQLLGGGQVGAPHRHRVQDVLARPLHSVQQTSQYRVAVEYLLAGRDGAGGHHLENTVQYSGAVVRCC